MSSISITTNKHSGKPEVKQLQKGKKVNDLYTIKARRQSYEMHNIAWNAQQH